MKTVFKVCARCKHVFIKKSCSCDAGTYRSIWALGFKETMLRWLKLDSMNTGRMDCWLWIPNIHLDSMLLQFAWGYWTLDIWYRKNKTTIAPDAEL
jgi:hypothetical protein